MKRLLLSVIVVAAMLAGAKHVASASNIATIAPTASDTASVLLKRPVWGWTYRINSIKVWYDGNTGANVWAGIVTARSGDRFVITPMRGNSYTANANGVVDIAGPIWITGVYADSLQSDTTYTAPLFFVNAATSDSISAQIDYDILPEP